VGFRSREFFIADAVVLLLAAGACWVLWASARAPNGGMMRGGSDVVDAPACAPGMKRARGPERGDARAAACVPIEVAPGRTEDTGP
jgi:hypothetical protein